MNHSNNRSLLLASNKASITTICNEATNQHATKSTNVIVTRRATSSEGKRVFIIRMSDGSWMGVVKIGGYMITVLLLLIIIGNCPKAQSLAVVGHISSSAANMAAAAASLLVAQGLQLDQQLAGAKKSPANNQQQYRLTFEPISEASRSSKGNGSSLSNMFSNRTGSEQLYAERRNFGQRIPTVQNISESILGQLVNPFNLSLSSSSSEGNSSNHKIIGGANSRLNLISRLLQYRLPRPNHSSLLGNLANKLSGSNITTNSTRMIINSNGTSNNYQPQSIDGELNEDTSLRDLQANSSSRDYQVVRLAQELQPGIVTLEVNGSSPDGWQETNNIEEVIKVRHEGGKKSKEEEGFETNKADGGKMRGEFGDDLRGHEEAGSWSKHKHGEQGDHKAGGHSSQHGNKWLKDAGHKRHGWKNVYHKEEYAQHQKFHDLMENKDAHDKLNANEEREHFNAGSKFNSTKSDSYYDKEKHGSKYDYVKGSQWRRQEEDQDQKHASSSKLAGGFGLKQHASRKQDLDGNPAVAYEESSSNDLEYPIAPTAGSEQHEHQDPIPATNDQDSEAPIEQMKDKLERLSASTRFQAEKRLNSDNLTQESHPDSQAASEQTNYAASSPASVSNEQDYDDDRDWSAPNELGPGGRQHESINDILKTAKAMRANHSTRSRDSHSSHNLINNDEQQPFRNSSNIQAIGSGSSETEPEDEEADQESDTEPDVGPPSSDHEKAPKKNEQIRLKLELDLGKSMAPGVSDSGKGVGLGVRGRPAHPNRNHTYVNSANSAIGHHQAGPRTGGGNGAGDRHSVPAGGNLSLAGSWPVQRPPIHYFHAQPPVQAGPAQQQQQQLLRQQPMGFSPPQFKRGQQQFQQQYRASNESRWSKALGEPNGVLQGSSRYPTEAGRFGLQDGQLAGYRGGPPTRRPMLVAPNVVNHSAQNSAVRMTFRGPPPSATATEWYPPHPAHRHHPPIQHHSSQLPQTNLLEALPNRPIYVKHLQMNGGVVLGRIQSSNRSERTIIPDQHPHGLIPSQMITMDPHHQSGQPTLPLGLAEDLALETSLNHALGDHHHLLTGHSTTSAIDQFNGLESAAATSQPLRDYLVGVAEMNGESGSGSGSHPHELGMSLDGPHQMTGLMDMENLLGEADSQQLILAYNSNSNNNNNNNHETNEQLQQHPHPGAGFAQGAFIFQEPLDQFVAGQSTGNAQQMLAHHPHQQLANPYAALLTLNQHQVQESSPNPSMFSLEQQHQIPQHHHVHQHFPQGLAMIPAMQQTFGRLFRLSRVFGSPAAFSTNKHQLIPPVQFHDIHSLQRQLRAPARSAPGPAIQRTPLMSIEQQQQLFNNLRASNNRWRSPLAPSLRTARNFALKIPSHPRPSPSLGASLPQLYTKDYGDLLGAHSKPMPASIYDGGQKVVGKTGHSFVKNQPAASSSQVITNATNEKQLHKSHQMRMRHTEKLMMRKTRPEQPVLDGQRYQTPRLEVNYTGIPSNLPDQEHNPMSTQATLTTTQISITQRPHLLGDSHRFQHHYEEPAVSLVTTSNPIESNSPYRLLVPESQSESENRHQQNLAAWLNVPYVNRKPIPMHFVGSQNHNENENHDFNHNHNHIRFSTIAPIITIQPTMAPNLSQTTATSTTSTTTTSKPAAASNTSKAPFFGQRILANFKSKFSNVAAG